MAFYNIEKLQHDLAKTKDPIKKAVLSVFLEYMIRFQSQQLDINKIMKEQNTSIDKLKKLSVSKRMTAYNELLEENTQTPMNMNDKILDRLNSEIDIQFQR